MLQVREHGARTVIAVVTPGSGELGIKTLNDKSIGRTFADRLLAERNRIYAEVFAARGLTIVTVTYKVTTVVSTLSPAQIAPAMKGSITEIQARMRVQLAETYRAARAYWETQRGLAADAPSRLHEIEAVLVKLQNPDYSFEFQLGASEVSGGKGASYEQVLGAEQNASKAAMMARDPSLGRTAATDVGDSHAMLYSEEQFVAFAKETIAKRDALKGKTLPLNGKEHPILDKTGRLDRDIAWGMRSKKGEVTGWGERKALVAEVKALMDRVNTLDYIVRFEGKDVGIYAADVKRTGDAAKKLRSGEPLDPATVAEVKRLLEGSHAQEGGGSEAKFYEGAAATTDRVVVNADIRDLGIDVVNANLKGMQQISEGQPVDAVSRGTSDPVVELRQTAIAAVKAYYVNELLPKAQRLAAERGVDLGLTPSELREPLMLVGGDELTISVPRAFQELGLVNEFVAHVKTAARARVAVTRTGTVSGAKGHADAMKHAEGAHTLLKEQEVIARELKLALAAVPEGTPRYDALTDTHLWFEALYTTADEQGVTTLRDQQGNAVDKHALDQKTAEARTLLSGAS